MSKFNLPPGVTANMIPGNRPEDEEWEKLFDHISGVLDEHNMRPREFYPFVEPLVKAFVSALAETDERRGDELADYADYKAENPR